jgi:ADP-ribosylglycohydrolase
MPVHWYYNRKALYDDYGRISDYLALKYPNDPEKALVVNTNLGGDNVYRGAVLGALLGAEKGLDRFPRRRVTGLLNPPPEMRPPAG